MAGPTVRRLQLGIALRKLREAAGVTRPDAAAAIKCAPSRIGHIEKGRNVIGYTELLMLLREHYGADQVTIDALEQMRQEARERGWWSVYGLPEWLAGYVGLEYDATSLRCLELALVPGLLQTEAYMRKLYTLPGARLSAEDVEKRINTRLKRQERLVGTDPLQLSAVVAEEALIRCSRDPEIGADQLALLLDRAELPNVELRVLPLDLGLHAGMAGTFSLLSFPDSLLNDAVYQEYTNGGDVIDSLSVVSQMDTLFNELRGQSLGPTESLALIAQLAEFTVK